MPSVNPITKLSTLVGADFFTEEVRLGDIFALEKRAFRQI